MPRSTEFYGDWVQHHGKVVEIDGHKHRIRCSVYMARYPTEREVISVYAEPVDKTSEYYLESKRKLKDDWATDILDSDVELQSDVLQQCEQQPPIN